MHLLIPFASAETKPIIAPERGTQAEPHLKPKKTAARPAADAKVSSPAARPAAGGVRRRDPRAGRADRPPLPLTTRPASLGPRRRGPRRQREGTRLSLGCHFKLAAGRECSGRIRQVSGGFSAHPVQPHFGPAECSRSQYQETICGTMPATRRAGDACRINRNDTPLPLDAYNSGATAPPGGRS